MPRRESPSNDHQTECRGDVRQTLCIHRSRVRWTLVGVLVSVMSGCGPSGSSQAVATAVSVDEDSVGDDLSAKTPHGLHPVMIRSPRNLKLVETGLKHPNGNAVSIACNTCHTTRPANRQNRNAEDLDQFHQGLKINHGKQACVACHDQRDGYVSLHLADGLAIEFSDSMRLCAQCHGSQFRDYEHGSHGGMNGYWDRTRGPRERNHCLHCHDPHAPQIEVVQPVPGPRDRFPPAKREAHHE